MVEGTEVALSFEDDSLSVSAGCNTMSAPYVYEDGKVTWTGGAGRDHDDVRGGPHGAGRVAARACSPRAMEVSNDDGDADLVAEQFDVVITFVER